MALEPSFSEPCIHYEITTLRHDHCIVRLKGVVGTLNGALYGAALSETDVAAAAHLTSSLQFLIDQAVC